MLLVCGGCGRKSPMQEGAQDWVRGYPGAQVGEWEGRGVADVWRVWRRTNPSLFEEGVQGRRRRLARGSGGGVGRMCGRCGGACSLRQRGGVQSAGRGSERGVRRTALLRRCAGQGRGYAWVCSSLAYQLSTFCVEAPSHTLPHPHTCVTTHIASG